MEALWGHTQTPTLHERWDLRFSRIEYLPRGSENEPQRFLYATRIGFGFQVAGEGESVRNLASSGLAASHFTTEHVPAGLLPTILGSEIGATDGPRHD